MRRGFHRPLSLGIATLVATALFVTARVPSSAYPAHASLPVLRLNYFAQANGKLAKSLDPALITAATSADTVAMIDANLVAVGVDNKVHLQLANKMTISKNRKVYTFTIRPNARYSNGHYVTASDIKASIEEALAPSTASPVAVTYLGSVVGANEYAAGKASSVSGVKVLSKRVIQISITKPYAYFLKTLTYSTADALDQTVIKGKSRSPTANFLTNNCPGNQGAGPFKFKCFGDAFFPAGQTPSYTMVPNPYYYGKKPHIQVEIPAIDTVDTSYKTYLSGGIDTTFLPTGFIPKYLHSHNSQFLSWATSRVYFITPNQHMAPMNDVHCRLAVSYGINRKRVLGTILHNIYRAIYDVVPPGFLGYYSGADNPHFNLAKAKAEFSQCASKSTPLKITYPTTSSDIDNEYNEIANELKAVGFSASTNSITINDWYTVVSESLDKTKTQIVHNGWQQDYPDPQDYVTLLLRCGEDYDIGGYCNNKFNSLVDRADVEGNTKTRAQLYIQAQHLAISQGAWIPVQNNVGYGMVKPYVHGLTGTVAYADLVPVGYDWSRVSVTH